MQLKQGVLRKSTRNEVIGIKTLYSNTIKSRISGRLLRVKKKQSYLQKSVVPFFHTFAYVNRGQCFAFKTVSVKTAEQHVRYSDNLKSEWKPWFSLGVR